MHTNETEHKLLIVTFSTNHREARPREMGGFTKAAALAAKEEIETTNKLDTCFRNFVTVLNTGRPFPGDQSPPSPDKGYDTRENARPLV